MPRIAVVIPAHNVAPLIGQAIDSVERSAAYACERREGSLSPADIAIVVVDDASTDNTASAVEERARANPRIMLLRSESNRGPSHSRNVGAAHADAELLFFLDGDDAFCEPHLHLCLSLTEKFPEAGMIKTGIVLADPIDPHWYRSLVHSLPMNICIRAECHAFIGGFDERLRITEDAAYCHMVETFFSTVYVDTPTVRYNRYPGNSLDRQYAKFAKPPGQGPRIPAVPPHLEAEMPRMIEDQRRLKAELAGRWIAERKPKNGLINKTRVNVSVPLEEVDAFCASGTHFTVDILTLQVGP